MSKKQDAYDLYIDVIDLLSELALEYEDFGDDYDCEDVFDICDNVHGYFDEGVI